MKTREDELGRHSGITYHRMPVAGIGGLLLFIAMCIIFVGRLPEAKFFILGSLLLGWLFLGAIRLVHKIRPETEVEKFQLNVGRQLRQPIP